MIATLTSLSIKMDPAVTMLSTAAWSVKTARGGGDLHSRLSVLSSVVPKSMVCAQRQGLLTCGRQVG